MKWVTIAKSFAFEAAHLLPKHKGKCKDLHGHRWEGEVSLLCSSEDLQDGMVIDFAELKSIINKVVVEKYDHKNLNLFFEDPTCELIALQIHSDIEEWISKLGNPRIVLDFVKLYETPGNYCTVSY